MVKIEPPADTRYRRSSRPAKQRRLLDVSAATTDATSKSYDDGPMENIEAGKNDPVEDKGREAWQRDGKQAKVLEKFNHPLQDWAFFPKCLASKSDIRKYGVPGIHYGAGYKEFGQMLEKQGEDYSKWPRLVIPKQETSDNNSNMRCPELSTAHETPITDLGPNDGGPDQALTIPHTATDDTENIHAVEHPETPVEVLRTNPAGTPQRGRTPPTVTPAAVAPEPRISTIGRIQALEEAIFDSGWKTQPYCSRTTTANEYLPVARVVALEEHNFGPDYTPPDRLYLRLNALEEDLGM